MKNSEINEHIEKLTSNLDEIDQIIDPETNVTDFSLVESKQKQIQEFRSELKQAVALLGTEIDDDFKFVQENLKTLIIQANGSLDRLISIADISEHPRVFEVLSTYIGMIASINKDLLALHKTKRDIIDDDKKDDNGPREVHNTQNNVIFDGSTSDLLQQLLKQKKAN